MRLPDELSWTTVKGQTEPPLGWYSPCFGGKIPTTTLVGAGAIAGGQRLMTELRIDLQDKNTTTAESGDVKETHTP